MLVKRDPPRVPALALGIYPAADFALVDATLQALAEHTRQPFAMLLLADTQHAAAAAAARYPGTRCLVGNGAAAAFNRLAGAVAADVYVFLEAGTRPARGWLDALLAALAAAPHHGLAGPSTNRAWNEQAAVPDCRVHGADIDAAAGVLARRHGAATRTLAPLYSLADFCYAVKREVIDAIGPADEGYGHGPCWEMDYNVRAARAGFDGLWVAGAFVYRAPQDAAARERETRATEASKRRYQDKFCGWLHQSGGRYSDHCRGDACAHFARPAAVHAPTEAAEAGPLVSCVMPTRGRPAFVARSIGYFLRQDYPARELIIAYEDEDDIAPRSAHPAVRYLKVAAASSIGAKRNAAVAEARGTIVAQWDDDDWYADTRLSRQVAPIRANYADVTGLTDIVFLQLDRHRYWETSPALFRMLFVENVSGGTLVYRRSVWGPGCVYPATSLREDADFLVEAMRRGARLCRVHGRELCVYVRHAANTWKFEEGRYLKPGDWRPIAPPAFMGADRGQYAALAGAAAAGPLVSCIMPTAGRPDFVAKAIRRFLEQDYPHKEMIIVDDGEPSVEALVPAHPAIRYRRLANRASIGAKRNIACEMALGELIAHWDDDDWMAADWLRTQVETLRNSAADICGLDHVLFYAPAARQAWRYVYDGARPWVAGGTLCYTRALWRQNRFPDIDVGEDNVFIWNARAKRIAVNPNADGYVATVHPGNTSPKATHERRWRPFPVPAIERLLDSANSTPTTQLDRSPA
jgi:glycosyltransferase involved in cell wall biosynthesis